VFVELNKKQVDAPSLIISHPSKMEATSHNYSGVQESDSPYMLWLDIIAGIGFSVSFFFSKLALPNSNTFHETYSWHCKWEVSHQMGAIAHDKM
jgi:hypothetical protein